MSDLFSSLSPEAATLGLVVLLILGVGISLLLTALSVLVALTPAALILGVTLRFAQRNQRLASEGILAPAEVLSVDYTGVKVLGRPQFLLRLRIQPDQGEPFEARCLRGLNLAHVPQVQPGAVVEVRYDPADPRLVALIRYGAAAGAR